MSLQGTPTGQGSQGTELRHRRGASASPAYASTSFTPTRTSSSTSKKKSRQRRDLESVPEAKICWYCDQGEINDGKMKLYRFCMCEGEREWTHMHCICYHIMVTIDQECPDCQGKYRNWRIRRTERGSRYYAMLEVFAVNWYSIFLTLFTWGGAINDWRNAIKYTLNGVYQLEWSYDWNKWWERILHNVFDRNNAKATWVICTHAYNVISIPLYTFWLTFQGWSARVGHYIIFNKFVGQQHNRFIAYHKTESEQMRERYMSAHLFTSEYRLRGWFIKQKKNDNGYNYHQFEKDAKQGWIWKYTQYWHDIFD